LIKTSGLWGQSEYGSLGTKFTTHETSNYAVFRIQRLVDINRRLSTGHSAIELDAR
jgi:hypothetical protein